jgi:hypothetical protein
LLDRQIARAQKEFIEKKSDPAGGMRLRLKQDRPPTVHAAVICVQATTKVFGVHLETKEAWSLTAALLRQLVPLTDGNQNSNC